MSVEGKYDIFELLERKTTRLQCIRVTTGQAGWYVLLLLRG